jgi:ferrous iron transport protein A
MIALSQARVGFAYYVAATAKEAKLQDLGFVKGKKVELSQLTPENAIVSIAGTRIAMDKETLDKVFVTEIKEEEALLELSLLKPGETGIVRKIDSDPATKHRLMDMGITRGTAIYIRKLAPLGDPMELHLRGYSLSLRKQDASLIKVVHDEIKNNK